jgi:ethanolamine ammonia-lyase small subunit
MSDAETPGAWEKLKRFTEARIALGRTGSSLPTRAVLEFGVAHAQARDAVHAALQRDRMIRDLEASGFTAIPVHSAASDRAAYLQQPGLGRRLDDESRARLRHTAHAPRPALAIVIADGLSAVAAERHALPVLHALRQGIDSLSDAPIIVAEQARVALADEIGEILGAEAVAIFIGERPGLSSPDSMGIYLTYSPRVGRTDAERNCISNIRAGGLGCEAAARKLLLLLSAARLLGATGVTLRDDSDERDSLPPRGSGPL